MFCLDNKISFLQTVVQPEFSVRTADEHLCSLPGVWIRKSLGQQVSASRSFVL